MSGPLDGIKVVEFSEIIAGPVSGVLLSDLGADVIKVEPPWGDPWRGSPTRVGPPEAKESRGFIAVNRGKR
ncbi:MAG: CoA transferase, partial [Chloroflexi bacterium]|nr:CoA transferase [Chloroflexota bacterium]